MSVIPAGDGLERQQGVTTEVAHTALTPTLAHGVYVLAGKAKMAASAQEAKDFADAALKLSQIVITLDPNRLQGGDTPQARKDSLPDRPPAKDADHDGKIGS